MSGLMRWMLGYALNAVWQVPLVFGVAWVAARLARRVSVGAEHRVWVGALLLEVALPGCGVRLDEMVGLLRGWLHGGAGVGSAAVQVALGSGSVAGSGVLRLPARVLVGAALFYGVSVVYFAGRLGWGIWRTAQLRRRAVTLELQGEAAESWARFGRRLAVTDAAVAVAAGVRGPVTVGWRRGVMLVPAGFVESVAAADFAAVCAHELAHLRRRDFAKNLLYEVVSLPVAFHPVVWRTRARVAESREMVCDALAAEAVAGRERYARALLRLAAWVASGTPERTLHAIGIFDANLFERRVMTLTKSRLEMSAMRRLGIAVACVAMGLATCASALALRMEVAAPAAQTAPAAEEQGPRKVPGGVMAGNILTRVTPVYPPLAKAAKIQGAVVLEAVIGRDGTIQRLEAVSGPTELKGSALDAVRQWTYKPYLLNGEPTEVSTKITVTYSLGK